MPSVSKEFAKRLQMKLKGRDVKFSMDEVNLISDLFVETLSEEVSEGKSVKLLKFGNFSSTIRTLTNNKKNKEETVSYRRFVVNFKSSRTLKDNINEEIKKEEAN